MHLRLPFTLALSVLTLALWAQRAPAAGISGLVVDPDGQAIPYASVLLLQPTDSAIVEGTATDIDGGFILNPPVGQYLLQISFLSFEDFTRSVDYTGKSIKLGRLEMSPSSLALGEVEVVERRSEMELKLDKRVMNVGEDLKSAGLNASEILEYVPSVTVDVEGNVSLRGSENVRILINGRPSGLLGTNIADALRQLPGDLIESVEVITNPSARYDAEGEAGIINIVLKKERRGGLNGSVQAVAGYPDDYRVTLNANYRTEKMNIFGSSSVRYVNSPGGGSGTQIINNEDTSYTFRNTRDQLRGGWSQTYRLGADFFLNDQNTLTVSGLYDTEDGKNLVDIRYFDETNEGISLGETLRADEEIELEDTYEVNLNYLRTFDEKDRKWTVDFQYIKDNDLENSNLLQTSTYPESDSLYQRSSNTENEVNFLFQSDYIDPLGNDLVLELGTRNTLRYIDNDFLVETRDGSDGDWEPIDEFNNYFQYREAIYAGYTILSQDLGRWSWQGGLRAEYTDLETELVETGETNPRDYLNWFPSAFLGYEVTENQTAQLSYSRRLSRPGFRQLLPFTGYNDNRNFWAGNPDLDPEYTNSFEGSYLVYFDKGSILTSAYYRHRTGIISRITVIDSIGNTVRTPVNLAVQDAYGFEFTANADISQNWRLNGNLNVFHQVTVGDYEGQDFGATNTSWTTRVSSQWNFTKDLKGQVSWFYRGPQQNAQGRVEGISSVDASVGMDLFGGKGSLTLNVRDLFNSRKRRWTIDEPGYLSESEFQWRQRQWLLTFSYRLKQERNRSGRQGGGPSGGGGGGFGE
ncbi:TonB-dependent receptor [Cryomorphaceae bacterium]|nr:TonB-dependent receptor [Cryomorphaceae bacterium]